MKPREFTLDSGIKIFLGKDSKSNDELMKKYSGKDKSMKQGTWGIKGKAKTIKAKRRDIKVWQLKNSK
jgi:hypothetical protein